VAKYTVQITIEIPDEDDTLTHVESWFEYAITDALENDNMSPDDVHVEWLKL